MDINKLNERMLNFSEKGFFNKATLMEAKTPNDSTYFLLELIDFANEELLDVIEFFAKQSNIDIQNLLTQRYENLFDFFNKNEINLKVLIGILNTDIAYLNSKGITVIPNEIYKLKKLKSLNLDSNKIKKLPENIGKLQKLERLSLANNQIKQIPSSIVKILNLNYLDLSNNDLESLPENIDKLKCLSLLDLRGNNFSKEEQKKIKKIFKSIKVIF
jgi:Leucine-rich repeat (LRR) protein